MLRICLCFLPNVQLIYRSSKMPRRSARRNAKGDAMQALEENKDNVVMMVLPPNIAEELAKSGGQLTPELLTAIAQETIKPVPLQFEQSSSDQEDVLGSTTSIKVTNSDPPVSPTDDASIAVPDRRKKSQENVELLTSAIITSTLPSEDSEDSSPKRVTRSSPKKYNEAKLEVKAVRKRRGRARKASHDESDENVHSRSDQQSDDDYEPKTCNQRGKGVRKTPRRGARMAAGSKDNADKSPDHVNVKKGGAVSRNVRTRRSNLKIVDPKTVDDSDEDMVETKPSTGPVAAGSRSETPVAELERELNSLVAPGGSVVVARSGTMVTPVVNVKVAAEPSFVSVAPINDRVADPLFIAPAGDKVAEPSFNTPTAIDAPLQVNQMQSVNRTVSNLVHYYGCKKTF